MPVPPRISVPQPSALPRIRAAMYGVAALGALALWLLAPRLLPQAPVAPEATPSSAVNIAALDSVDRDLQAWGQLLADPRLDQLQPPAQLQPGRAGNGSPFVREVAPAQ